MNKGEENCTEFSINRHRVMQKNMEYRAHQGNTQVHDAAIVFNRINSLIYLENYFQPQSRQGHQALMLCLSLLAIAALKVPTSI